MYRFHLCYVYVPQYESGGRHFYVVFGRTLLALVGRHAKRHTTTYIL
jgi:hypothetical protein